MTASIKYSSTTSTRPNDEKSSSICNISSADTCSLGVKEVIPAPTTAGVFGMALTSFLPAPTTDSICSKVTPAATDKRISSCFRLPLISSKREETILGFTAIMTKSASFTASPGEDAIRAQFPKFAATTSAL